MSQASTNGDLAHDSEHNHSSEIAKITGSTRTAPSIKRLLCCGLTAAALGACWYVLAPAASEASDGDFDQQDARRTFARQLSRLIEDSHTVLAVHARHSAGGVHARRPFAELVIWMRDDRNRGVVDPDEVALLSHSQVFRAINWHTLMPADAADAPIAQTNWSMIRPGQIDAPTLEELATSAFADAWRTSGHVTSRLVASGVSDLSLQATRSTPSAAATIDLELIWAADSTDGPGRTAVTLHCDVQ